MENIPIFGDDDELKKNNERNGYIQARVSVKRPIWKIFKGIVQMKGYVISDALTDAIITWLESVESIGHRCQLCDEIIAENDFYILKEGKDKKYYCSKKCLVNDTN